MSTRLKKVEVQPVEWLSTEEFAQVENVNGSTAQIAVAADVEVSDEPSRNRLRRLLSASMNGKKMDDIIFVNAKTKQTIHQTAGMEFSFA